MKFKPLGSILYIGLMLICLQATANTPLLIITGLVTNEDSSGANQVKVYVVNKTRTDAATPKWTHTKTDKNGRYHESSL